MVSEVDKVIQEGMQRSLFNADLDWRFTAEQVVDEFAKSRFSFTSDDVLLEVERMGYKTGNGSALGAIMKRAAKDGKIAPDHFEQSKRPSRHKAPVRVWRSRIYEKRDL